MQRHTEQIGGKTMILASWISASIVFLAVMLFSLYFNYRLNKLIKMLDDSILDRP